VFFGAAAVPLVGTQAIAADASSDNAQPIFASINRAISALAAIGQPISAADAKLLQTLSEAQSANAVETADKILSKYTLAGVTLEPDGYARTVAGGASRQLVEEGWAAFLVRVANPSGSAARLNVTGTRTSVSTPSTGASRAGVWDTVNLATSIANAWYRTELYQLPPIGPSLSGAAVDYQVIQIFSRDRGKREMHLDFWTSTDPRAGFHSYSAHRGVQLSFDCMPSSDVLLRIRDADGRACMASLVIKDRLNRVYPFQAMRLEPDMYFQPQIYRAAGESVRLPEGEYVIEARRGPEYLVKKHTDSVKATGGELEVQLERWIDPAKWGWYSGDTHIHGGGCAHYEHPTEGVSPATMIRHVRGEGLSIGDVLSWGPSWYFQKQFFTGHAISPSADLANPELQSADNATWTPKPTAEDAESMLRYDVEVSGFPSSHCGHLVLLRIKEQDYPGTSLIQDWPSWNLPVLKWAKAQGGIVGYAHCGIGMQVDSTELPNYEIPPMDGIGTQEAIVDLTHGVTDFLSGTNTFPVAELNAWYHLLNCGFRLALLGETDYPCISGERPGVGRSYVKLDERPVGNAGYENWVRNLALGRLYCGDGRTHFLDWNIAGQHSGEKTIELAMPGVVVIKCLVAARLEEIPGSNEVSPAASPNQTPELGWNIEKARLGQSSEVAVELIVNGRAVEQHRLVANGQPQELSFSTRVERSSWIALRVLPSAHTHPIFVEVGGKPIRASKQSAQWCRKCVDKLWEVKSPQIRQTERPAAQEAYNHARQTYDRIITESTSD
jgi:hypothetical protein